MYKWKIKIVKNIYWGDKCKCINDMGSLEQITIISSAKFSGRSKVIYLNLWGETVIISQFRETALRVLFPEPHCKHSSRKKNSGNTRRQQNKQRLVLVCEMQKLKFLVPLSRCLHRNGFVSQQRRSVSALPSYTQPGYLQEEEASFKIFTCIYLTCLNHTSRFFHVHELVK